MRGRKERAYGPYGRGRLWRVIEIGSAGQRAALAFESYDDAYDYKERFNARASGRSVSAAIDEYRDHLRTKGLRDRTIVTYVFRLHGMLRDVELDREMSRLSPSFAARLYALRVAETKPDTHHGELATVQAWAAWCVRQGWLREDPFAGIEPVGRSRARTSKLRIDEMRSFQLAAMAERSKAAAGALLAMFTGLRATEITDRVVRDVDDGGRILWIDESKTKAGERYVEVPEDLRPMLAELAKGKQPGASLFGRGRHWLRYHVRRLCRIAGVPVVSPHALRRSWSSLQAETSSMRDVSRALGHADTAVTRRHYVGAGIEARRGSRAVLRVLAGGQS